jgi:hypothetical protein
MVLKKYANLKTKILETIPFNIRLPTDKGSPTISGVNRCTLDVIVKRHQTKIDNGVES